jgi:predicted kinase
LTDGRCATCGRAWLRLPLFVLDGATGVGKSTVGEAATPLLPECVHIDGDVFWSNEYFDDPGAGDRYYAHCLRVAVELSQSGRPVVFRGANDPDRWRGSPLTTYFTGIHYFALVADPDVHERRLRARELPDDISLHPQFPHFLNHNRWIRANAALTDPPMTLLDVTTMPPAEAAAEVAAWVRARL